MLEINTIQKNTLRIIEVKGRIDGMTSSDLEKEITRVTSEGDRVIAVNLACINYVSSAGLRVFLSSQKMLKNIGGELLLLSLPPQVTDVFSTSGFASLFRIFTDETELLKNSELSPSAYSLINGMRFVHKNISCPKGKLFIIGDQEKLQDKLYRKEDVVKVNSFSIRFGAGIAVLGDNYEEYKNLFGETAVINHNFYSYPAAKKSAVDYMLKEQINSMLKYNFLYGFGVSGGFSALLKLPEINNFISLNEVINASKEMAQTNLFGVVMLAESGGIYAMNLKKSPIAENKPDNEGIFAQSNFSDWMDFPIEPSNSSNIIAAVGIAVKDRNLLSEKHISMFSEDSDFHLHCIVFEKDFLSKNLNSFDDELNRVAKDLKPLKVQHLLSRSKFKSGMLGIIELEEF